MSNVLFLGDSHFRHRGIFKFGLRTQFSTIEEHDDYIVEKINSVMSKNDIFYHVGDVTMGKNPEDLKNTIGRIKGRKILIRGNHDNFPLSEYAKYFEDVCGTIKYKEFWLSHFPIHPQEFYRRTANIHGHIHDPKKTIKNDPRYICVSPECLDDYTPISLDEIRIRQTYKWDEFFERLEKEITEGTK